MIMNTNIDGFSDFACAVGGGGAENSKWVSEVVPSKLQEGSGHTVASGEMVGVKKF
jgi:hypothetical protein